MLKSTKTKKLKSGPLKKSQLFKVNLIESESGWGQRVDETKSFRSKNAAIRFIDKFNAANTQAVTPAWFMYAMPANFNPLTR